MRRSLSRLSAVLLLAVITAFPAYGAPKREDGETGLLHTIVRIVQKAVHALDDIVVNYPKP